MKSTEDIIQEIKSSGNLFVKVAVTDIDGIIRGKIISLDKLDKSLASGIGFCNVIFGWDSQDVCYTNSEKSGWHTGFGDAFAQIDTQTYRELPWDDKTALFLADFSSSPDFKNICPRSLLKNVISEADKMGFVPKCAKEFEWYNFDETSETLHFKEFHDPIPLTRGMFGYSLLRASQNGGFIGNLLKLLSEIDIPIDNFHTETGPGVYEASIQYSDALLAADRAAIFKNSVKEIAFLHETIPTFMAKWNSDLPGSGAHIHQSLWDKSGKNVFYDGNDSNKMSELLKHFVAGQLHCLPHILPMFAPTVNSYNRYVEGSWAATTVSWGIENRTTALRVINHDQESIRVEHRVSGSDINPYLSIAASLASGLYGIKHKLELKSKPVSGNAYQNMDNIHLHDTLHKATTAMKKSEIANELFGKEFVDHFIRTREWEWKQFKPKEDNWELKRYFEII